MIDLDKLEASCTRNSDLPPRFSAIKALELIAEVRKLRLEVDRLKELNLSYHRTIPIGAHSEETK